MLEHASVRKKSVLRLKSGDPLIFGRAGEEIVFLTEHRIPFEIVPGITAAFAVAAQLKTPLTDRSSASKLIFATAHHAKEKIELTPKWEGAFPPDATLVVYMPGRNFRLLADELIASGIAPETPCVAVSRASTPQEHILHTTLALINDDAVGPAPVLLLIGHAIQPVATEAAPSSAILTLPLRRRRLLLLQTVQAVLVLAVLYLDIRRH